MIAKVKMRKIGRSFGVILPKYVAQELGFSEGESLLLQKATDGRYYITRLDPEIEEHLRIARKGFVKYGNVLRESAK